MVNWQSPSDKLKKLKKRNQELCDKNRELREENDKLVQEKEHILESATRLVLDLHRVQEQMEIWNRKDGEFFDRIMPMVQMLYGCLEARDQKAAEKTLGSLKEQILNSRGRLFKNKQISFEGWSGEPLSVKDIDDALKSFENSMGEKRRCVLYQNLVLPMLCVLAGDSPKDFDGEWRKEVDEILQSEGLRALYYNELELDDVINRSMFVETNGGRKTPGIFLEKKEGGYMLFGNYHGRIPREKIVSNDL